MKKEFEISDDSSFLGLVNADKYHSFIAEDWEFDQLKKRIISESNKGHLLCWGTDIPNIWTVRICDQPIAEKEIKAFQGKIKVTNSRLYLINYESLIHVAQFEEEHLPEDDIKGLFVQLDNGVYEATVRQLLDADEDEVEEESLGFEIVLRKNKEKSPKNLNSFNSLIWSEY